MSRIGKLPVNLPAKVKASVEGTTVRVEGPKGKLEKSFNPTHVKIEIEDASVMVEPAGENRLARAMHGTARSIIQGMVTGVTEGFEKNLEIQGVGFKADVRGKVLNLNLGYAHDINFAIPEGVTIEVDGNTKVKVTGCDKQMVGQAAAQIKSYYPVEPYKGKGVRIVGEYVRRKEGKKAG